MSDRESRSHHDRWIRSIVDQYEGRLLRYASHLTGDVERARDVVQETFLRLWCRPQPESAQQDAEDGLAPWLFVACRNCAHDTRRKEQRMKTMSAQELQEQAGREADQAQAAEHRDANEQVQQLLADFTANQQEVVRLKFQEGLSYREISHITNLSISNVGYLIHTALEKLRRQLRVDPKPAPNQ